MMEAVRTSETSANSYLITWQCIPEDSKLQSCDWFKRLSHNFNEKSSHTKQRYIKVYFCNTYIYTVQTQQSHYRVCFWQLIWRRGSLINYYRTPARSTCTLFAVTLNSHETRQKLLFPQQNITIHIWTCNTCHNVTIVYVSAAWWVAEGKILISKTMPLTLLHEKQKWKEIATSLTPFKFQRVTFQVKNV
jgi:hypothetical protein